MRTVTAQSVLYGVALRAGLNPTQDLDADMRTRLGYYIQARHDEALRKTYWPELTLVEQRQYRANYLSSSTYAAPTVSTSVERYDPRSGAYYQTLRAVPINEYPATLVAGSYVENSAYWAKCAATYQALAWSTGLAITVGQQYVNPADNRAYQCHTAHTSGASFDTASFGVLTPFLRYISDDQVDENGTALTPLGEVRAVTMRDPRINRARAGRVDLGRGRLGIMVDSAAPNIVFVEFRIRPNTWNFTVWAAGTSAADTVRFYSGDGECYRALVSTTAVPGSDASKWLKLDFPFVLANFAIKAASADRLGDQNQNSRKNAELALAQKDLQDDVDMAEASQGQFDTIEVGGF